MQWQRLPGYRLREIEFGFSPTYSITTGALLGDGKCQYALAKSSGDYVVVLQNDGRKLWEANLANHDTHGVTPLLIADVDRDGEAELVIGEHPPDESNVLVFSKSGQLKRRIKLPPGIPDYAGVAIDSLALADIDGDGVKELAVAVNGGYLYVLDARGEIMLAASGFLNQYEHFLHAGDLDGDGMDELLLSASNSLGPESATNHNCFFVIDQDGRVLWARSLREIGPDAHVDYALIDDFDEDGQAELFTATGGCLFDAGGRERWSLRDVVNHGQWADVARARTDLAGKQILLSELWGYSYAMLLVNNDGTVLWRYADVPEGAYPTHAYLIDWEGEGKHYAIFGEQPGRGNERWELKIALVDAFGNERLRIPFEDHRVEGWTYNFENSPAVADVDGDGREEFVFPTCKGTLMVVGAE